MHGVRRTRQSREAIEARKQREQAKIKEYLALTDEILLRKTQKDWGREAFDLTLRMLHLNPEFYTVWNYRRTILSKGIFPNISPEEINKLVSDELNMTTSALKIHPKVYWLWNHRQWCLENVPDGPGVDGSVDRDVWRQANWDRELVVVEKMLDADPRNFHAWNYRRYVLASMPVRRPEKMELAYTLRKIESNFSNFSAWHQRSKSLSSLWASGELDQEQSKEDEFELLRNAMYTDPNDQSVWIYHRWLIGLGEDPAVLEREITVIQELLDEQPDSKWCMESLFLYKRLLIPHRPGSRARLAQECVRLLEQLETLDPARKRRYLEIMKSVKETANF